MRASWRRLRDFPGGDLPGGQEHERLHPAARAVGGERRGGVAGRGAGEAADAEFLRHADADGHAAVLERAGGVHPLVFDAERLDAHVGFEARDLVEGRRALGERDALFEGQRGVVPPDPRAFELVEGRQVIVADLEQAVARSPV